jgi:hypothetical protein
MQSTTICIPDALFEFPAMIVAPVSYQAAVHYLCYLVVEYGEANTLAWNLEDLRKALRLRPKTAVEFWKWLRESGLAHVRYYGQ